MYESYDSADFNYSSTNKHMKKVYGWMFIALLVTAIISIFTSGYIESAIESNQLTGLASLLTGPGLFVLLIAEFILVMFLAARVHKMSPKTAFILFLTYAALNGVTLSGILLVYTTESIVNTFLITTAMFGALSVYAHTTKKDMSGWGTFLFMALIGLLIATIVNWFLVSTGLQWIITIAGVLIFAGLTAYDTQKIKNDPVFRQYPVLGALELYLDFLNMFLYLLRIFGERD